MGKADVINRYFLHLLHKPLHIQNNLEPDPLTKPAMTEGVLRITSEFSWPIGGSIRILELFDKHSAIIIIFFWVTCIYELFVQKDVWGRKFKKALYESHFLYDLGR